MARAVVLGRAWLSGRSPMLALLPRSLTCNRKHPIIILYKSFNTHRLSYTYILTRSGNLICIDEKEREYMGTSGALELEREGRESLGAVVRLSSTSQVGTH